jgi:hypothetical protein
MANYTTEPNATNNFSLEIKDIFENNTLNDLKRFIKQRQNLNTSNSYLIYLFHLVQSAGILTSAIAAGNNNFEIVWIGVGLNLLATLINVYEKTNNSILQKLMNDIELIKNGKYVDESQLIDTLSDNTQLPSNSNSTAIMHGIDPSLDNSVTTPTYKTFNN